MVNTMFIEAPLVTGHVVQAIEIPQRWYWMNNSRVLKIWSGWLKSDTLFFYKNNL